MPYTDFTWAGLGSSGLLPESAPKGWTGLYDLAVEAHERTQEFCSLDLAEWRALIDATAAGLPITITRKIRSGTQTATYIVRQILSIHGGTTSNLYVRTWGFAYPLALGDLVSVVVPETTYEMEYDESECPGHESTNGPIGNVEFCDGTCQTN